MSAVSTQRWIKSFPLGAALGEKIQGEAYLTNFKALAKAIAPDREEIETVGFTAFRGGQEKSVALKPVRRMETAAPPFGTAREKPKGKGEVVVTRTLLFADAMEHKQHLIKFLDENGSTSKERLPLSRAAGMLSDSV